MPFVRPFWTLNTTQNSLYIFCIPKPTNVTTPIYIYIFVSLLKQSNSVQGPVKVKESGLSILFLPFNPPRYYVCFSLFLLSLDPPFAVEDGKKLQVGSTIQHLIEPRAFKFGHLCANNSHPVATAASRCQPLVVIMPLTDALTREYSVGHVYVDGSCEWSTHHACFRSSANHGFNKLMNMNHDLACLSVTSCVFRWFRDELLTTTYLRTKDDMLSEVP